MPSEAITLQTQPEKPHHYMYLKEFRTQQCPLFLQHKCTQHRPFTCFHWHFLNQRRRRPIRRRDGTFNYSPDQYCTKYDETTGVCPDGDECPNLHRTAGDTERRYHLRYYKTGTCVYETDSRGHCVKNGPHCAFAHGAHDVRPPVYDIHEVQSSVEVEKQPSSSSSNGVEKEKVSAEDQKWNDTNYVLANYKTEQCKRPPRLCRQGYACPQYHNTRDRRRSPKKFKYRSTPCPNVKHGDEWGDPTQCENGDGCTYCHTRTEQQFHPEIYKSTKCNDMVQTGACPRGPFCAFAHVEQEMTTQRDVSSACENSLAAFVTSALPEMASTGGGPGGEGPQQEKNNKYLKEQNGKNSPSPKLPDPIGKERSNSAANNSSQNSSPLPEPIGKGRSGSICSDMSSPSPGPLQRAPGSEREDAQAKLRQLLQAIDKDPSIDPNEKNKRKQNLVMVHMPNYNGPQSAFPSYHTPPPMMSSSMSPLAPAFYPPSDTVESVVGKALEELELDFDIACVDRDLERDTDANSVSSSFSAGLSSSNLFNPTSGPIGIPGPGSQLQQRGSIGSLSQSPSSPFGSLHHPPQMLGLPTRSHEPIPEVASSPFFGRYSSPFNEVYSMSPHNGPPTPHNTPQNTPHSNPHNALPPNAIPHSPQSPLMHPGRLDLPWEHENPGHLRSKLPEWEGYGQAKNMLSPMPPMHQQQALRESGGAGAPGGGPGGPPFLQRRQPGGPQDGMPLPQLCQLRQQMLDNFNALDQIISQQAPKCLICQCQLPNVSVLPCKHQVFCPSCVTHATECPLCHSAIQKASIPYTMQ